MFFFHLDGQVVSFFKNDSFPSSDCTSSCFLFLLRRTSRVFWGEGGVFGVWAISCIHHLRISGVPTFLKQNTAQKS